MAIYFYRVTEKPYGCFSNFSAHSFELDGLEWQTSEHYYQAQKFAGTEHVERVRLAPSPMEAAKIGRDKNLPMRSDWDSVKDTVMRRAVLKKFQTHTGIRRILLDTGDVEIIENTSDDYYWGCGTNKTGKNMLGIILMEVRETLRAEDPAADHPGS